MNINFILIFLMFSQLMLAKESLTLKGDYLGQTAPGDTPVVFARGIVSSNDKEHWAPRFSPDGNEVFWWSIRFEDEKRGKWFDIHKTMRRVGGRWTAPEISPFDDAPVFSPDGKRLYFGSKMEGENPYFVEKQQGNNWSNPIYINLITRFPDMKFAYFPSIASNGTLYFVGHLEGQLSQRGIYRAELANGEYAKPQLLPPSINFRGEGILNWTPYIAPDESYLIFCSNRSLPKPDHGDLYISFRQPDGSWTDAASLGEPINSKGLERFPAVSPDGKYLFFTRNTDDSSGFDEDAYWMSAGIIEKLKAKAIQEGRLKQSNQTKEIHLAVDAGDLSKVQTIIEANPTLLELKDEDDRTPLMRACLNRQTGRRQVEAAKFLIAKGAKVNVVDNWRLTPLLAACVGYGPDFDLIQHLIAKNADVNALGGNGITALHWAAQYRDLKVAKFLIDHGADVNAHDQYKGPILTSTINGTALQVAINGGSKSVEVARLIIENGANLNRRDLHGNTELHLVAMSGSSDLARLLIQHGADVHAVNEHKRTALYYAAKHGYRGVADVLIAAGAESKALVETNYGKAPELDKKLRLGEAYIWPLKTLGAYAVKTKGNLLVFTIGDVTDPAPEAGLANGSLHPSELAGQKITMLLNHRDPWNMGTEAFVTLAKLTPGVKMVSSFKPDFSKENHSAIPNYRLAAPNETFPVNGIRVHTIPATAGGVGYLVEADGVKIFHAGLHVSDNEAENFRKFRKEIDFLKPFGPIDIVMLTVHSHSNYIEAAFEPYLYLLDQLTPKAIYLSGANPGTREQYLKCAEVLQTRNIPVFYPEIGIGKGERSHYLRDPN